MRALALRDAEVHANRTAATEHSVGILVRGATQPPSTPVHSGPDAAKCSMASIVGRTERAMYNHIGSQMLVLDGKDRDVVVLLQPAPRTPPVRSVRFAVSASRVPRIDPAHVRGAYCCWRVA